MFINILVLIIIIINLYIHNCQIYIWNNNTLNTKYKCVSKSLDIKK